MGDEDRKESRFRPGQTRREFIRKLLLHSSYVVPTVVSFTAEGVFGQKSPSGMMMMTMMSPSGMDMMMDMDMDKDMGRSGDIWKKPDPKKDKDKK